VYVGVAVGTTPVGDIAFGAGGPSTVKLRFALHVPPESFFACTAHQCDPWARAWLGVHEQLLPVQSVAADAPPWNSITEPSPTWRK
jgi:hypothetical protein